MAIETFTQQHSSATTSKGFNTDMQRNPFFNSQRVTQRRAGFSLVEMLVVVVIIAILVVIAIPIYQNQIRGSRRTAAKTALLDLASREEKYFSTNNAYTTTLTSLGYSYTAATFTVPNNAPGTDYYSISIKYTGTGTPSSTNYIATATPINTQSADPCGGFTITDLGVQGNTGTQTTQCW